MKCEICHKNDAETAITVQREGVDEEIYVCRDCANKDRAERQKKSQRTRKISGLPPGISMSVTQIGPGGEPPPQILDALMNVMNEFASDLNRHIADATGGAPMIPPREKEELEKTYREFPMHKIDPIYRVGMRLHLEGLNLIGELEPVQRAFHALGLKLEGVKTDGVSNVGHVFDVSYSCSLAQAKRVVNDLIDRERDARLQLMREFPRVFIDSICRALALLKNCRLLSNIEYFDMLSPLRLAAYEKFLDGVTFEEIDEEMALIDLSSDEGKISVADRDKADADRADEINRRYEDVILNERSEELLK